MPGLRWGIWVVVGLATLLPLRRAALLGTFGPTASDVVDRVEQGRAGVLDSLRAIGQGLAHLVADAGDEIALGEVVDQAAELEREIAGRVSRRMTRSGLAERLGLGLALVFLLGWIYAKPRIATVGPDRIYGFGGLAPALQRASDPSRRRAPRSVEEAEPRIDPESGAVELEGPRGLEDSDAVTLEPGEGAR